MFIESRLNVCLLNQPINDILCYSEPGMVAYNYNFGIREAETAGSLLDGSQYQASWRYKGERKRKGSGSKH